MSDWQVVNLVDKMVAEVDDRPASSTDMTKIHDKLSDIEEHLRSISISLQSLTNHLINRM